MSGAQRASGNRTPVMTSLLRRLVSGKSRVDDPHGIAQLAAARDTPCLDTQSWEPVRVAPERLQSEGSRAHVRIKGRFISIVRHGGILSAVDSLCYHQGGPLGVGDIEDLRLGTGEVRSCIVCPWHDFKFGLQDGHKYYQALRRVDGKTLPGAWTASGKMQRVHKIKEESDGMWILLDIEGDVAADEYACDEVLGLKLQRDTMCGDYLGRVSRDLSRDLSDAGSNDVTHAPFDQDKLGATSASKLPTVASGLELQ